MKSTGVLPLVSVIVPVYNVKSYIDKCVDSILSQTYKNIELILVDDGSTDGSRQQIEKYKIDSRCTIVNKKNGGASSARNVGIDTAIGDYIYFIDADDFITPTAIEELLATAQNEKADFYCYRFYSYDGNTYRLPGNDFTVKSLIGQDEILKDAFLGTNIKVSPCLKFFNASFIKDNKLKFFEAIICEDYLFTVICAMCARKVVFINKPLYYVFQRTNSVSRSMSPQCITSYYPIDTAIRQILKERNIYDKYLNYYEASIRKQILYTLLLAGYKLKSYGDFLKLYELSSICNYNNKNNCNLLKFNNKIYWLYRISLHPLIFYLLTKMLKYSKLYKTY